jgi:hypothetical protein
VEAWAARYARVRDLSGYQLTQLARAYTALGESLRPSPKSPPEEAPVATLKGPALTPALCAGIARLVAAYRVLEEAWKTEFDGVVARSKARLGSEPLLLPTFAALIPVDHENAVSNVLAEVLKLLPKTAAFGAFDQQPQRPDDAIPRRVEREWPVAEGHIGRRGRLDLVAVYPDGEWLVLEIKVVSAGAADLAKNAGYARSLDGTRVVYQAVTLVRDGAATVDGHGFAPLDWRDTLLRLRWALAELRASQRLPAVDGVLLLALVGVLERRLLNLRLDSRLSDLGTRAYLHDFHTGPRP